MKKELSIIYTILIIVSTTLQCNFCQKSVEGHLSDSLWYKFDMKLWTFRVNHNDAIFVENAEILTAKNEGVKGLNFNNNKNIKFPPVNVHDKFPHLVAYQIYNCSLKEIRHKNFEHLKELQVVYLGYNHISHIPPDTFKDLLKLKFLSLRSNLLQSIDEHVFQNLRNLRDIYLNDNQIAFISKHAFEDLTELRNISISDNKIERLTNEHFQNNKKLEKIFLSNNKITSLSTTMFDNMKSLVGVYLKDNICIDNDYQVEIENCTSNFLSLKAKIDKDC